MSSISFWNKSDSSRIYASDAISKQVANNLTTENTQAFSQSILDKISLKPLLLSREESTQRRDLSFSGSDDVKFEQEVLLMEKKISSGVINAMKEFLNKHEAGKGIWYPNDYRKYLLKECNIEMDESFRSGFANEEFFEKTGHFTFALKEGKQASKALLSFLEGPTVADCGNATMACYYKCILDLIGEARFDQVFSAKSFALTINQSGIADETSPIGCFSDHTEASKYREHGVLGKRPLRIGEECHFDGVRYYANKHPQGHYGGWNVVYVGDDKEGNQLFLAHGSKKPITEKEINRILIEEYNEERTPQEEQYIDQSKKRRAYDKDTHQFLRNHYTISEEQADEFLEGFLSGATRCLDAKKLLKLKVSEDIGELIKELRKQQEELQKLKKIYQEQQQQQQETDQKQKAMAFFKTVKMMEPGSPYFFS